MASLELASPTHPLPREHDVVIVPAAHGFRVHHFVGAGTSHAFRLVASTRPE